MAERVSFETFVDRATVLFGDAYNYTDTKSMYKGVSQKVPVRCRKHGVFWIAPSVLLRGHGCAKCARESMAEHMRMTTEDFITQARLSHGDFYDYSITDYVDCTTPVWIICPKHGKFSQIPTTHNSGHGCPQCAVEKSKEACSIGNERFVKEARKIHGDLYDYSRVKYTNLRSPVEIICPIHGSFFQRPDVHLRGFKCQKCGSASRSLKHTSTWESFLDRAIKAHGFSYEYERNSFHGMTRFLKIKCLKCGKTFKQKPCDHVNGVGCPHCHISHLERQICALLEEQHIRYEREKRFDWLRDKNPLPLDFYLPDFSVAIECQGIQHFEPVGYFGGEYGFNQRVRGDKLKQKLCAEHSVRLLYFTGEAYYDEFLGQDLIKENTKLLNSIHLSNLNSHGQTASTKKNY